MKKFLSILLAAILCLGLLPTAFAESEPETVVFEGFLPMRIFEGRGDSEPEAYAAKEKEIIDAIGVKPVPLWLPYGSETEKLNVLIADESTQLDLITTGNWDEYAKSGVIMPLNELLEQYGQDILAAYSEFPGIWDYVTDSATGNIYGVPRTLPLTQHPIWMREDWFKALGMEQPHTVAELNTLVEKLYEADPAGNGQTIPMLLDLDSVFYGLSGAYTKYGYGTWLDETDGRVKLGIMQDGMKDCIAQVAEWYEKGYVYQDSFTIDTTKVNELITAGRVGVSLLIYSPICINLPELQKTQPEASYVYSPDFSGEQGFAETCQAPSNSCMMILARSEHPEAAMKYLNWFMDKTNFIGSYAGRLGIDWEWVNEDASTLIRLDTETYDGEFYAFPNNLMLRYLNILNSADEEPGLYTRFLTEDSYRTEGVKYCGDYGTMYSTAKMKELAPNKTDIDTMIREEVTNFITGVRSMDEWDSFINDELTAAGVDKVIDAYTTLYNEQHAK